MATLDTAHRDRLHDKSFAWIDKQGERHLPINDETHVRNAIARSAAARKHGIEVEDTDDVMKAARR